MQTPRRIINDDTWRDASGADERILQLNEIHRQQLAELKLRNERLQEEKTSKNRSRRYNLILVYSSNSRKHAVERLLRKRRVL